MTGHAGRYDLIAQRVLEETGAKSVVLFVYEGGKGNGMSVSTKPAAAMEIHVMLPTILRVAADAIAGGAPPDGMRVTAKE